MRFPASVACLLVAVDCAKKAVGLNTQHLLAPDVLWLFWPLAAAWTAVALRILFEGTD